jgi:amino acid transporter
MTQHSARVVDEDDSQLEDLGYKSEFKRDMGLWANLSLGFTYLSPMVNIYAGLGVYISIAGPPVLWSFLIAGAGQLLVALVFGELVAQWPVAGGVYPWARRLWGRRWAWMTGWFYILGLLGTLSAVACGVSPYLASLLELAPTPLTTACVGAGLLLLGLLFNLSGTKVLSYAALFGFTAELVGALVVGCWLLIEHRHQDFSMLFNSFGAADQGDYLFAFFAAGILGCYQYYGFEACGDMAEEVRNPGRTIPKAMRYTIYVGGTAATFACFSLLMAMDDMSAVVAGDVANPVETVLAGAFGPTGYKIVVGVVLISFISCVISLQAAASRIVYAYARDDMIIGSRVLRRFSARLSIPPYALLVAVFVPIAVVFGSMLYEKAFTTIVAFSTFGIYLTFQMVVLAALRARLKGWRPTGAFRLVRSGAVVNVIALIWGVSVLVNVSWPRSPEAPWYENYAVVLSGSVVLGLGLLYLWIAKPHLRNDAPFGDAVPERRTAEDSEVVEKVVMR